MSAGEVVAGFLLVLFNVAFLVWVWIMLEDDNIL